MSAERGQRRRGAETAGHSRVHRPLLCALLFGLACGASGETAAGDGGADSAPTADRSSASSEVERIEHLSAIGYLAGAEEDDGSGGVTRHDLERVAPGLNLITSGHAPVAVLMDMEGRVVHEWRAEFEQVFPGHPGVEPGEAPRRNFWRSALLLPDGRLVVIWELFGIFELSRDSRVVWAVSEPAHHDLQLNERGEIVHLQAERRMIPGIPGKPAIEDFIVTRGADGRELGRLALSDALRNIHWPRLRKAFWSRARDRGYGLDEMRTYDPFHTNSLWLLNPAEAARLGAPFRAGDALVSMAMLDTIAILDLANGSTRWSQQGPFGMQHAPRLTRDGRIVLFDNFREPHRSSVLTFDPRTRRVVSEYAGSESEPLHSRRSGRIQVLSNGNTLAVETDGGRALELAEDGEVVWEFHSPYRLREPPYRVAGLYSLQRVDGERISWLISSQNPPKSDDDTAREEEGTLGNRGPMPNTIDRERRDERRPAR